VDHTVHASLAACHLLKSLTLSYIFCGNEYLHGTADNLISQLTSLEISSMQGFHLSDAGRDYLAFMLRKCSDLDELHLDGSLVTTGKPDVIALFNALEILNRAESCRLRKLSITSDCHSQSNILVS
jgi:Ran GTPase-activating protein (RanGAP) involved in mRNA processing and transport